MRQDANGLTISTSSDAAAAAYDHLVAGYLAYRADLPDRLAALLQADPDFALGHCLKGSMTMLALKQSLLPAAIAAEQAARDLAVHATARERAHVAALAAWIRGDTERAIAVWEQILADHPHDVVAMRLAHFSNFWLGRAPQMAASIDRLLPHWSDARPGYASLLACHCFAQEECGNYAAAEAAGRRAIELDPGDLWAAHGVAHVMEMQGRRGEGIAWLGTLAPNWEGSNNLQHHLWWHCALFHLEHGDTDAVLALYDTRFRNLAAPLTVAAPDVYIDVQNAASMLFRLELRGVDVGERWIELADLAEPRIGDCLSPFTLPHWMMALAATGRDAVAARLLQAMHDYAQAAEAAGAVTAARIVRDYALPVTQAVCAHRERRYAEALAIMRPALGGMHCLGGSHAQQDVLEQLFLDAATRAGHTADIRMMLERVAGRRPLPPERMAGWRDAAKHVTL